MLRGHELATRPASCRTDPTGNGLTMSRCYRLNSPTGESRHGNAVHCAVEALLPFPLPGNGPEEDSLPTRLVAGTETRSAQESEACLYRTQFLRQVEVGIHAAFPRGMRRCAEGVR
jgi:hypothetical protein